MGPIGLRHDSIRGMLRDVALFEFITLSPGNRLVDPMILLQRRC